MNKSLRSDTLKILAMLFMFVDHFGAVILNKIYVTTIDPSSASIVWNAYEVCRAIGRLAMPIFCYQIVVGVLRTGNRYRYIGTLVIAGVLSEISFDLAGDGKIVSANSQNVMFTLALCATAISIIEWFVNLELYRDIASEKTRKIAYGSMCFLSVFTLSVVAELIKCDYGAKAVILAFIFYYFREDSVKLSVYGILLFMLDNAFIMYLRFHDLNATIKYCCFEAYACLSFLLIVRDNGIRKGGKTLKWIGYAFYPVHLLVLYLVSTLI